MFCSSVRISGEDSPRSGKSFLRAPQIFRRVWAADVMHPKIKASAVMLSRLIDLLCRNGTMILYVIKIFFGYEVFLILCVLHDYEFKNRMMRVSQLRVSCNQSARSPVHAVCVLWIANLCAWLVWMPVPVPVDTLSLCKVYFVLYKCCSLAKVKLSYPFFFCLFKLYVKEIVEKV